MGTKQHEYQLEQWSILIQERLDSGKSVRAWCAENDVTLRKYYYWLKQVRQEHFDEALDDLHAANAAAAPARLTSSDAVPQEETHTFVELSRPHAEAVITGTARESRVVALIRTGGLEVEIFSDTSEECLRRLIAVLRDA